MSRNPSPKQADNRARWRLLKPACVAMFEARHVPPDAFFAAVTLCAKDWTRFSPPRLDFAETSASASPPGQAEPPEVSP